MAAPVPKELSPYFYLFILCGKCHFPKSNKYLYYTTLIYNCLMTILGFFVLIVVFIPTPMRGNIGLNLNTTYWSMTSIVWSFVTSVVMFKMSAKNEFCFQFSRQKICSLMTSRLITFSSLFIVMLYTAFIIVSSLIIILEKSTINRLQSCLETKEILSFNCTYSIQRITNIALNISNMLIPMYISAYSYLIGQEFTILYNDMRDCPKLFGMSDATIESYRLKYNDLCDKVDDFSSKHGVLVAACLFALLVGAVTCGYNFFAPAIIPGKYLWPSAVFVSVSLLASFLGPSYLLNQAKKPWEILLKAEMKNASERTMIQTHLFMTSVQNFGGITVLGFMNMDKPSAIGILGVIVTYVLVVVQYQPQLPVGLTASELTSNATL